MNDILRIELVFVCLFGVAPTACSAKSADPHESHLSEKTNDAHGEEGHGAHEEKEEEHGHGEASDLDRPIADLFSDTCEHSIRTYACDECRYEVGVVKAPAELFTGGLLKTVKAETTNVSVPLALTGEVRFDERRVTHVSTQTDGIIRKVNVMLGDQVKKGQALLEIESVTVGDAEAEYLEARGMLQLVQRSHDWIDALHKEAISSEKELLSSKQELDTAQIRTNAALGKLIRLGMTPSAARSLTQETSRGRLVFRAPAAGTILQTHAVAGEVARSESPLVTIGENSSLWVWADLYEQDVALVTREHTDDERTEPLSAEIEVKAFPGEPFQGVVDFISPSMSESSRTVKVRIAVPNPRGRLLAGMFASVKIFLPSSERALTVPAGAILDDDGRTFVFVHHEDAYYVRRGVVTGRAFDGRVEILKGLKGTEQVVSEGAFLLKSDVLRSKMGAGCAD